MTETYYDMAVLNPYWCAKMNSDRGPLWACIVAVLRRLAIDAFYSIIIGLAVALMMSGVYGTQRWL